MEQSINIGFSNVEEMRMGSFNVGEAFLQLNNEKPIKIGNSISAAHYLVMGNVAAIFLQYGIKESENGIYASGYYPVLVQFKPFQIKRSNQFVEGIKQLIGWQNNLLSILVYDQFPNTKIEQIDLSIEGAAQLLP
jgi:hypothetical protein